MEGRKERVGTSNARSSFPSLCAGYLARTQGGGVPPPAWLDVSAATALRCYFHGTDLLPGILPAALVLWLSLPLALPQVLLCPTITPSCSRYSPPCGCGSSP